MKKVILASLFLSTIAQVGTAKSLRVPASEPEQASTELFYPQRGVQGVQGLRQGTPTTADIRHAIDRLQPRPARLNQPYSPARLAAANTTQADIYGYLYYSNPEQTMGLYKIDPFGTSTFLWQDENTAWGITMMGGWLADGKLCGIDAIKYMGAFLAYCYVEFDLNNGQLLKMDQIDVGENLTPVLHTSAYRDLDGKVYGYGYNPTGEGFAFTSAPAYDLSMAKNLKPVDYADFCVSLCYNSQTDCFYGITTSGKFVEIDFEGSQTEIFDINLPDRSSFITGLVYSPVLQQYVWNAFFVNADRQPQSSAIYAIDPAENTVSLLSTCRSMEEYMFLVTTDANVTSTAPAKPEITLTGFENGSLSGNAVITFPAQTQEGTPLLGDVDFAFIIDGDIQRTGEIKAGETATLPSGTLTQGFHTIAATASYDGHKSLAATTTAWFGNDTPEAPQNPVLSKTSLRWQPSTKGIHDGFVDPAKLTYIVKLNGKEVGRTQATSLAITLPDDAPYTAYTATVSAEAAGLTSEEVTSNIVQHGVALNPPLYFKGTQADLDQMTTINVDGRTSQETGADLTWFISEDMGFPAFISGFNGDDWLILPPTNFDTNQKAFQFIMDAGLTGQDDTSGTLEVYYGTLPTAEAMTNVILPAFHCSRMMYTTYKEYFAVPTPGTYYIGIHAKTGTVGFHVSDVYVNPTEMTTDVPQAVGGLIAEAGENGQLFANVTFTLPSLTAAAAQIPETETVSATISSYTKIIGSQEPGDLTETITVTGKPGEKITTKIKTAQNYNDIKVSAQYKGLNSVEETAMVYTGLVVPYIVQNLTATVTEDNMGMTLRWDPPVEGEEPGAIGDTFLYVIYYYNSGWEYGDTAGQDVYEYTYTLPEGADQQWVTLGVMAYNAAGLSYHISGVTEVIGTPYSLPMDEQYTSGVETYEPTMILRPTKDYEGTYWMMDDPKRISTQFRNDSGVAMIGYAGEGLSHVKTRLALPKFSTSRTTDVTLSINYWGGNYAAPMRILGTTAGFKKPVDVAALPASTGWSTFTTTIPATLEGRKWVALYLDADFVNDQRFAMFSSYAISTPEGVDDAELTSSQRIWAQNGILTLQGFKGQTLRVTDLQGRLVIAPTTLSDINGFALQSGVYIVNTDSQTVKIKL